MNNPRHPEQSAPVHDRVAGPTLYIMRDPCSRCGSDLGSIERRNGQDCVYCSECSKFQYNAPRTETGERQESVTTLHNGIKPKQRARVLVRSNGLCELCGNRGPLHVSHLLSVKDALTYGLSENQVNHDDNLAAFCAECNLGMGASTITPRLFAAILQRHTAS